VFGFVFLALSHVAIERPARRGQCRQVGLAIGTSEDANADQVEKHVDNDQI